MKIWLMEKLIFKRISGDMGLLGGRFGLIFALCSREIDKRKTRSNVQTIETFDSICATLATTSCFCSVQLYHWLHYVLCENNSRVQSTGGLFYLFFKNLKLIFSSPFEACRSSSFNFMDGGSFSPRNNV